MSETEKPEAPPPSKPSPEERLAAAEAVQQLVLRQWWGTALRRRGRAVPALIALLVAVSVVQLQAESGLWAGSHGGTQMLLAGAWIPELALRGEVWRALTWWMLHADPWHLLLNILMLMVIGRPVEAIYGGPRLWLIWLGSALAAAMASLSAPEPTWTIGASGAAIGLLGALVGLGIKLMPRLSPALRWSMVGVPALALAALLSLSGERLDRLAHVGGALGGIALGVALRPQFLAPAGRRKPTALWLRLLAMASMLAVLAASAVAVASMRRPLLWPEFATEQFKLDSLTVRFPANLRRGTLHQRGMKCTGELTDGAWALRTRRMPCWPLPLSGLLVLGERETLFSMDAGDQAAFARANLSGRFERRQEGVLVYPLGDRWVWVVFAEEPLLPTYARALGKILAPPGQAKVEGATSALPTPAGATPTSALPGDLSPAGAGL